MKFIKNTDFFQNTNFNNFRKLRGPAAVGSGKFRIKSSISSKNSKYMNSGAQPKIIHHNLPYKPKSSNIPNRIKMDFVKEKMGLGRKPEAMRERRSANDANNPNDSNENKKDYPPKLRRLKSSNNLKNKRVRLYRKIPKPEDHLHSPIRKDTPQFFLDTDDNKNCSKKGVNDQNLNIKANNDDKGPNQGVNNNTEVVNDSYGSFGLQEPCFKNTQKLSNIFSKRDRSDVKNSSEMTTGDDQIENSGFNNSCKFKSSWFNNSINTFGKQSEIETDSPLKESATFGTNQKADPEYFTFKSSLKSSNDNLSSQMSKVVDPFNITFKNLRVSLKKSKEFKKDKISAKNNY